MNASSIKRTPEPVVAVVLHDAASATWAACQRVLDAVSEVAPMPVTLLAVPRYHGQAHGPAFEAQLQERFARGDELALHGYTHWDDGTPAHWLDYMKRRWYTASEGEFCALGEKEALQRLQAGAAWFAQMGWPVNGFVAPAWLMSPGTWSALQHMAFAYTCTLTEVHDLRRHATTHSHSLVYSTRAAWRRALSRPVNRIVARSVAAQPLVRLELHPWDADYAGVRRSWQRLLGRFLEDRRAVTMMQALEAA